MNDNIPSVFRHYEKRMDGSSQLFRLVTVKTHDPKAGLEICGTWNQSK